MRYRGGGSYGNKGVVGRRREWDRARRPEPFLSGSLCWGTESPLHYTSSRKELWLRAGSLCVPIVESVTRRGNPPTHQERCHWQEAGLFASTGQVSELRSELSPTPSNLVVGPVSWTGIIDKETWLGQHLVLWLISGAGCFAFLPKEVY